MERGEIWLVSLDPTAGHEQQGTRPVLIVTPAAFNRVTRLPVVVPVTSGGNFARTAGFAVSLDGVGIRTTGVVRCDQPRTIDMKARGGKRLERVPETIMNEVLDLDAEADLCEKLHDDAEHLFRTLSSRLDELQDGN